MSGRLTICLEMPVRLPVRRCPSLRLVRYPGRPRRSCECALMIYARLLPASSGQTRTYTVGVKKREGPNPISCTTCLIAILFVVKADLSLSVTECFYMSLTVVSGRNLLLELPWMSTLGANQVVDGV